MRRIEPRTLRQAQDMLLELHEQTEILRSPELVEGRLEGWDLVR